jgi:hypothetical protein
MHKCPGPECETDVATDKLACPRHWYQVTAPVRSAVYRAWANGAGGGTAAHRKACELAISQMRPLR